MSEFNFMGCVEIQELLGTRANDVQKLLESIEEVPIDSIYFHTHSYFLRHYYISGPYSNDFANWAVIQVRDRVLGEKLSSVTPSTEKSLEDIRFELIDIIDQHLMSLKVVPFVVYGQPFYFMKSRILKVPTGHSATTLKEFVAALKDADASSIYNHMFEARQRDNKGRSDFSIWLEDCFGLHDLAARIESLDSYMFSLEGLRQKLIEICSEELGHE